MLAGFSQQPAANRSGWSPSHTAFNGSALSGATGTPAVGALSNGTPSCAGSFERFVAASDNLVDPAVAISYYGTPLLAYDGANIQTGVNAGSGGDFVWTF